MIVFCQGHPEIWNVVEALLNADSQNGRNIYSTYQFGNRNILTFDLDMLMNLVEDGDARLVDCTVVIQDTDISARNTMTKTNKLLTYFIVQTRQRSVDLYIVGHSIDFLDKRVRVNVDAALRVDGYVACGIQCTLADHRNGMRRKIRISDSALRNGLINEENIEIGEGQIIDMEGMLSEYVLEVSCLV